VGEEKEEGIGKKKPNCPKGRRVNNIGEEEDAECGKFLDKRAERATPPSTRVFPEGGIAVGQDVKRKRCKLESHKNGKGSTNQGGSA